MKIPASTILLVFVLGMLIASAFGLLGSTTANAAPPSTPLAVTIVPSQPFATQGSAVTQDTQFANSEFVVPAGKRLVVETVTFIANVPAGDVASCGLSVEPATSGQVVAHHFAVTPQGPAPSPFHVFVATSPVRLYFGAGDELNFFCFRNGNGFLSVAWSVSGYLVDV